MRGVLSHTRTTSTMQSRNRVFSVLVLIALAALSFGVIGCRHFSFFHLDSVKGSGVMKSESRSLTGFQKVESNIPATIIVSQSPEYSFKIEADDNLLPLITTEVKNGQLVLSSDKGLEPSGKITVTISAPEYKQLSIAGSGSISGMGLRSGELKLEIAGAGEITLDLSAEKLTSDIAGSGSVHLKGNATKHSVDIAGSGTIDAPELNTETTEVDVAGSGKATIHVAKSLKVDISGSGNVFYSGDATDIKTSTAGSGRVTKVN